MLIVIIWNILLTFGILYRYRFPIKNCYRGHIEVAEKFVINSLGKNDKISNDECEVILIDKTKKAIKIKYLDTTKEIVWYTMKEFRNNVIGKI